MTFVYENVDEIRVWEDEHGLHARIPFSRVDRAVKIYFGIIKPDEIRHVRSSYRHKQKARKRRR